MQLMVWEIAEREFLDLKWGCTKVLYWFHVPSFVDHYFLICMSNGMIFFLLE